jgi:hypothetical protein
VGSGPETLGAMEGRGPSADRSRGAPPPGGHKRKLWPSVKEMAHEGLRFYMYMCVWGWGVSHPHITDLEPSGCQNFDDEASGSFPWKTSSLVRP